jgi:hypothetical protein
MYCTWSRLPVADVEQFCKNENEYRKLGWPRLCAPAKEKGKIYEPCYDTEKNK